MDINQSIEIVKSLANGIDPTTGEIFAMDSPYNHPMIIRALFGCLGLVKLPTARKVRRTSEQKQADNLEQGVPRNANLPWTPQLLSDLSEQYNGAIRPNELAVKFERTLGSIVAQLKKMGLMSEEEARQY